MQKGRWYEQALIEKKETRERETNYHWICEKMLSLIDKSRYTNPDSIGLPFSN